MTDSEAQVAAVQAEINEAKQARTDEHLGLTRRQREATIARLLAKNDSLEKENEQLRSRLGQRSQDQPAAYGQAPQYQLPAQPSEQLQYTPQQMLEQYHAAQSRIVEEEKSAVDKDPDYMESISG